MYETRQCLQIHLGSDFGSYRTKSKIGQIKMRQRKLQHLPSAIKMSKGENLSLELQKGAI